MFRTLSTPVLLALLLPAPAHAHEQLTARLDQLGHAIEADPADVDALLQRAAELRDVEQFSDAARDLDRVTALAPDHPVLALERALLALATGDDARPWLDAHCSSPDARAAGFDARAALHEADGRRLAARSDREEAWLRAPTPDRALALARIHDALGDPACGAATLAEADTILSGAVILRLERVRLLQRAGLLPDALVLATELVNARGTSDRLLLRASVHDAMAQPDLARADRRAALAAADARLARRPSEMARAAHARAVSALGEP